MSCRRSRRTERGRHRAEVAANEMRDGGGYDLSIHVLLNAAHFVTREEHLGKEVWVGLGRWWSYSGGSGVFV